MQTEKEGERDVRIFKLRNINYKNRNNDGDDDKMTPTIK